MDFFRLAGALAFRLVERVELPRKIVIKNIRLGVALRLTQAAAVVLIVWLVFYRSQWIKVVSPFKAGIVAGWDDTGSAGYQEQDALDRSSGICSRLSTFDYIYSTSWRYENYSCSTPVQTPYERFWKEGDSLMYLPTAFDESHVEVVSAGGADNCSHIAQECSGGWQHEATADVCRCSTSAHFLVTGVDALTIAFDHEYSAEVSASVVVGSESASNVHADSLSSQRSDVSCDKVGRCDTHQVPEGKTKELKTVVVVLDKDRREQLVDIYDAPSTVKLPLRELFAKSGISLDTETQTIETVEPGTRRLPTARQTGMAITVNLQYSNKAQWPSLPCDGCLDDHVGPVCKAVVTLEPGWQSRPRSDCGEPLRAATGEGSCTGRYYYGLKVSFIASGSFGVFDFVLLVVTLGAGLVYLSIPLIIINAIAMYFIGALSQVYKKADREEVAVDTQLAGFVIRMIMAQSAYVAVTGSETAPLTSDMLLNRIHACVKQSDDKGDLDRREQIKLADLVMQVLDVGNDREIHMHEFVHAVTSNDAVNLKDAIKLFDEDRKLGCMERIFKTRSYASHCNTHSYFKKKEDEDSYVAEGSAEFQRIVSAHPSFAGRSHGPSRGPSRAGTQQSFESAQPSPADSPQSDQPRV